MHRIVIETPERTVVIDGDPEDAEELARHYTRNSVAEPKPRVEHTNPVKQDAEALVAPTLDFTPRFDGQAHVSNEAPAPDEYPVAPSTAHADDGSALVAPTLNFDRK